MFGRIDAFGHDIDWLCADLLSRDEQAGAAV
jgi:hypothetical protein